MKACIFDLDGVLVDSAKYHYLAWKALADKLGFVFTEKDNERLKGVSRMKSLEILLSVGNVSMTEQEKEVAAREKNELYRSFISKMTPDEILPGVETFLKELKSAGIKTAVGSASKNTSLIMERTGLEKYFDAVSDGTMVEKAKPDPAVFLKAAELEAALNGGMKAVGVGDKNILHRANLVIFGFEGLTLKDLDFLA